MASGKEAELYVIETTGDTRRIEIKWIFRNVSSEWSNKKPGVMLASPLPTFHAKGDRNVKWSIEIYPNGDEDVTEGYVSAFLRLKSSPFDRPTIEARFSFTLRDEENQKVLDVADITISRVFTHRSADEGWGWGKFAKLISVLQSNVFSFTCKLEYAATTSTSALIRTALPLSNEGPNASLSQDLEQYFSDRSSTDVCFIIDRKEIKAHKMILSARSPVFAAMLESGMRETVENRVEINDIAPDIFESLLRFIYTDRVDLTKIDTKDLLAAANKYLLPLLKFRCQVFLAERINIENCVELLALADLHNAVHLKKSALNFVRLHRVDIMQTEGWKNLKQSRPDLAFLFDVFDSLL